MTIVFIAEKPELGRAIADALSFKKARKDGYIAINKEDITKDLKLSEDVIITWCFGHLLEFKQLKEIDKKYEKWSLSHLPYNTSKLPLKVSYGKNKQVKIVKDLLKNASTIVNAGDPDEEGQLLVDELLLYLKQDPYKSSVKRILINDNTSKAVQKSLSNLKQNSDFKTLGDSAYCRSVADYKVGMNFTAGYTLKAREQGANVKVLSVGRVQTPILNLVYTREMEVKNHVKEVFYNLKTDNNFAYNIPKEKLENKLCKDLDYIESIKTQAEENNNFKITKIEVKKEEVTPLLPYNLLELQAEANRLFKLKPETVKDLTQNLRERHKAITYNRSDCQYLTDEHYEQRKEVLKTIRDNLRSVENISTLFKNSVAKDDSLKLSSALKSRAFNNKNVSAHHAIIPTINNVDVSKFTRDEFNIYVMIAKRYLVQFLPNRINEKTKYTAINSTKLEFNATTSKTLSLGWQEFYFNKTLQEAAEENKEEPNTPKTYSYKKGEPANFNTFNVIEGETKPKTLYTFATLLKQLTNVTAYVKDAKIKALFKEKDKDKKGEAGGIGTPATRDSIIKLLFDRTFLKEEKGKIVTTDLGKEFLSFLPDEIKNPDMTALWAEKQGEIKANKLSVADFISSIDGFIDKQVAYLKTAKLNIQSLEKREYKPSGKQTLGKHKCKTCDVQNIVIKGKYGKFETCPKCRTIYKENKPKLETSDYSCPKCKDGKLIKRASTKKDNQGKTIYWWGCSNFANKAVKCKFSCFDKSGKPEAL